MRHKTPTNRTRPYRRNFPYQSPTFGTKKHPKSGKDSVYYWWWEYLRRNPQYRKTCESGGLGPLADLYKDFGDVRNDNFKAWWKENDRGAMLFARPPAEVSVRVLVERDKV